MNRGINRLGTGHMMWCEVRTGGGGGLVEIWWCRETFGGSCAMITSWGHYRGFVHIFTGLLSGAFAVGLTVRSSRTARGCQGAAGAAACLAFLETINDIRWSGNDLGTEEKIAFITNQVCDSTQGSNNKPDKETSLCNTV